MAWRIVISERALPSACVFKKEEPAIAASVLVRKSLLEDIGNNLTPIKIALILVLRRIKYLTPLLSTTSEAIRHHTTPADIL
jgi:hypothetical protein